MEELESFLRSRVDKLTAGRAIPLDLAEIAKECKVYAIDDREMIPEAAIEPFQDGFRIFLQSNFNTTAELCYRRRFSLAHELAHTFFYELRDGSMKPLRTAPTGEKLEQACHRAAALLLVPTEPLKHTVDQSSPLTAKTISLLTSRFDASPEVVIRRLEALRAFPEHYTPVLTHRTGAGIHRIVFAPHPPWLRPILVKPERGSDFLSWFFGGSAFDVQSDGPLVRRTSHGTLSAEMLQLSESSSIFDVRLIL